MYVQNEPMPNVDTHPHLKTVTQSYLVDHRYLVMVAVIRFGTITYHHLRIRYKDKKLKDIPYNELFEIKNTIWGKHVEAIMVFPKVSNHIDNSHTYHLFGWEGMICPNLLELYSYVNPNETKGLTMDLYVPEVPDEKKFFCGSCGVNKVWSLGQICVPCDNKTKVRTT